jgi:hypothetical protein
LFVWEETHEKEIIKLRNKLNKKSNSELHENERNVISIPDDKYMTKYEYIKSLGYPLNNFDYFLFEIANIIGSKLSKLVKMDLDNCKAFLLELIKISKMFRGSLQKCIL